MVCGSAWLACALLSTLWPELWFGSKPAVDAFVGLAAATTLVHLTARTVSGSRGRLLPFLEATPLVKLGHFSYSVYLTHLPVLALCYFPLRPLALHPPLLALAMLTLGTTASLLFGYAFHRVVERRFMRP